MNHLGRGGDWSFYGEIDIGCADYWKGLRFNFNSTAVYQRIDDDREGEGEECRDGERDLQDVQLGRRWN